MISYQPFPQRSKPREKQSLLSEISNVNPWHGGGWKRKVSFGVIVPLGLNSSERSPVQPAIHRPPRISFFKWKLAKISLPILALHAQHVPLPPIDRKKLMGITSLMEGNGNSVQVGRCKTFASQPVLTGGQWSINMWPSSFSLSIKNLRTPEPRYLKTPPLPGNQCLKEK